MNEREAARVAAALDAQPWRQTRRLSLRGINLRDLPPLPSEIAGLEELDLSGNRLTECPAQVMSLTELTQLDLAGNRLAALPPAIGTLGRLRQLDVSENRLTALPVELASCAELRLVDVYGNQLTSLGPLSKLPALVSLDASRNRLTVLDALPPSLEDLDLSGNELTALPPSLVTLQRLRRLDLSGNHLSSDAVEELARLSVEELYLDHNDLKQAPVRLVAIPSLRRFSARGNPFGELPPGIHPDRDVGAEVQRAVGERVSGKPDPERQYFTPAVYSFDFDVQVETPTAAREMVDLFYKRYSHLPARLELGDGTRIELAQVSRHTALRRIEDAPAAGGGARIGFGQSVAWDAIDDTGAFVAEAVSRVPRVRVLSHGDAPDINFGVDVGPDDSPRVLNAAITNMHGTVVSPARALDPLQFYAARIDIAERSEESVVRDPVPFPVEQLEPADPEGWWFDIVAASSDVDVLPQLFRVFLPVDGPSWVCGCSTQRHTCGPNERARYLMITFRTREARGEASLRVTLYDRGNAVQSLRLSFAVGEGDSPAKGTIDYTLAEDARQARQLPPRRLHVLTNDAPDGTHTILINDGDRAISVDVSELQASATLAPIRDKLAELTLGKGETDFPYNADNAKPLDAFEADLRALARLGSQLWLAVVPDGEDRAYLRRALGERSAIQISRVTRATFPWALIYDIPRETDPEWVLCDLLVHWDANCTRLAEYPPACPFAETHSVNTLCPYGFWGFRHLIEQPPSVRSGVLKQRIEAATPARAATARSLALDETLTHRHFSELAERLQGRVRLDPCDARKALQLAFADPALPLVYLYCHGRAAQLAGTTLRTPVLEIGNGEHIGVSDLATWYDTGDWGPDHWKTTAPLVFINGCGTAALSPEDLVSLVEALAQLKVAGVVGTEIAVDQRLAGEVALSFYGLFAGAEPQTVGIALHRTRIDLLAKGNVSGLVYTPYCSMDLALDITL